MLITEYSYMCFLAAIILSLKFYYWHLLHIYENNPTYNLAWKIQNTHIGEVFLHIQCVSLGRKKKSGLTVSGSECKELIGQHFILTTSENLNEMKTSTTLLRLVREVRSQGKVLPPNWRDRQIQSITTSWVRETHKQNPLVPPQGPETV